LAKFTGRRFRREIFHCHVSRFAAVVTQLSPENKRVPQGIREAKGSNFQTEKDRKIVKTTSDGAGAIKKHQPETGLVF
jgi:hypothetical protein